MPDIREDMSAKRILLLALLFLFLMGSAGYLARLSVAYHESSRPIGAAFIAQSIAVLVIISTASIYLYHAVKRMKFFGDNNLNTREKLNRNIIVLSVIAGAIIAIVGIFSLEIQVTSGSQFEAIITTGNIRFPIGIAIFLAVLWGVGMPILSYFWHKKAIDEQESAAYRDGAFYAAYAYLIGVPTWWILARGGMVPDINGGVIFVIFNFIWFSVWFAKKYG